MAGVSGDGAVVNRGLIDVAPYEPLRRHASDDLEKWGQGDLFSLSLSYAQEVW